jgi:hypothetical protein
MMIVMQSLSDDEKRAVFGEVIADELQAIHEYLQDLPTMKRTLAHIERNVTDLTSDMKVVKTILVDQSQQLLELAGG